MWRAEAVAEQSWARTAWLCHVVAGLLGVKHPTLAEYNPLELAKRHTSNATTRAWIERVRKRLPKDLSEAEIERRWERVKGRSG